jgi:hypothetical protein
MKVAKEAKLGLGIALVVGLIVATIAYLGLGVTGFGAADQALQPSSADVVQAFVDEGLEVEALYNVEDSPGWGTGMLPKTMEEGTRFELRGYSMGNEPTTGDVFRFATEEDQRVVSDYLETVGQSSGLFYTHVYETDGFLLKIDGSVPKPVADRFNEVFQREA